MASGAIGARQRWRQKCWQWARRYGPAEISGTAFAFIGTTATYHFSGDRVLAAIAGAVGESIGFYGLIATAEWRRERARGYGWWRTTTSTARLLLAEFGLIELFDTTTLRPLFMYLGPGITGGIGSGTLLGKLAADATFYGVAIVSYEFIQRRRRRAPVSTGKAGTSADEEITRVIVRDEITRPTQTLVARTGTRNAGPAAKGPAKAVRSGSA